MQVKIHRGTHQIGGIATEISTKSTRIIIDMGEELSLDSDYQPKPLNIPGVTDTNGRCDAILCTHNHGDHIGQLTNVRKDIPIYMGSLAKEIAVISLRKNKPQLVEKILGAVCYKQGIPLMVGDIQFPFCIKCIMWRYDMFFTE